MSAPMATLPWLFRSGCTSETASFEPHQERILERGGCRRRDHRPRRARRCL
ncbi:MAG: hypothetical protein MZV49_12115 [Rhodopseudomonas palustris]|nr:hypothetical protein [Rhodopseudomonas palustris]